MQADEALQIRRTSTNRSFPVMARRANFALTLALLASVLIAAPAFGSAKDVIRDCSEDGVLNGHYSHGELAKALDKLPSDLDEYTDCRAVIRSAELASARRHKGGPGVPGTVDTSSPPNAAEQRSLHDAAKGAGSVEVGGRGITPGAGAAPFKSAGFGTDLPPLVMAILVALAGAMLAGGTLAIRRHRPQFAAPVGDLYKRLTTRVKDGIARFRR
jgi:hypothetical protein